MSEKTYTFARLIGGTTFIDNPEEIHAMATRLISQADILETHAAALQRAHSFNWQQLTRMQSCPFASSLPEHPSALQLSLLSSLPSRYVQHIMAYAHRIHVMADAVIRALNLYSQTEAHTTRLLSALVMVGAYRYPLHTAFALGLWASVEELASPRSSSVGVLTRHAQLQESYLNGVGHAMNPVEGIPGVAQSLAHPLSPLSSEHISYNLSISPISVAHPLPAAHSLHDGIVNLEHLSIGQPGNQYGTVAIQRYTHSNGSHSWVVTIPGTDGQPDSPFGWSQNLNLMSSSAHTQGLAHSRIAVQNAMRQAGVQSGDKVALVGHSQGGIIAASLASDPEQPYAISHVVTAGSPIAQHRVNLHKTWVTGVETDREIVSNLDGRENPQHPHWLTIRGEITDSQRGLEPTAIRGASNKHELSHGMNYHRATYEDAQKLPSTTLKEHEEHFRSLTEGTMDKNLYFICRIA